MSIFCVPSPFGRRQPTARKFSEFSKFYEVDWTHVIGKGGFSTVYKGRERSTGRHVAVKKIPRQQDSSKRGSSNKVLKQEINAAIKVKEHGFIVSLFDVFVAADVVVLCMEYMEGDVLFKQIVKQGPIPEEAAKRHFHNLAAALNHLHKNNIVHRDLKPENLMFSRKMADDSDIATNLLKITDFGLSKILPDNARMMQTFCGTPAYLAPEAWAAQFAGQEYDSKVDTWALGVTLFVVISGYHPFDPSGSADLPTLRANVLKIEWAFDDPGWATVSPECKDLISKLICTADMRFSAEQILQHPWFENIRKKDQTLSGKKRPIRRTLSERIKALHLSVGSSINSGKKQRTMKEDLSSGEGRKSSRLMRFKLSKTSTNGEKKHLQVC